MVLTNFVSADLKELPELQATPTCDETAEDRQAAHGSHHPSKAISLCWAMEGQA